MYVIVKGKGWDNVRSSLYIHGEILGGGWSTMREWEEGRRKIVCDVSPPSVLCMEDG